MQRDAERQRAAQARAAAQATRQSMQMQNAALRARAAHDRAFAAQYAADRTKEAAAQSNEIQSVVDELAGVLAATLDVDDYLDLDTLRTPLTLPPFEPGPLPYLPPPPTPEQFLPRAPGPAARLFGAADRHQRQTDQGRIEFERAHASYERQRQAHTAEVEKYRVAHERRHTQLVQLCGHPHSWTYAEAATMPSCGADQLGGLGMLGAPSA